MDRYQQPSHFPVPARVPVHFSDEGPIHARRPERVSHSFQRVWRLPALGTRLRIIACTTLLLMLAAEVSAQVTSLSEPFEPAERIVEEIEQAHDNGELNLDQSHLQKFYADFEPDRLMPRFRSGRPIRPLRCATPLITAYRSDREQLDAATRSELDGYVENTCPPAPAAEIGRASCRGRVRVEVDGA